MVASSESGSAGSASGPLRTLMRSFIGWRWAPLLTALALALCAQLTLLSIHPVIPVSPDSREYLARASAILHAGQFADPRRTPGYPSFLALILFLSGGRMGAVFFVQCGLFFVAAAEVYLMAARLTGRPWIACLVTAPVALNIYMLDWAYSIRDEAFSYWIVVTLLLLTERLARHLRPSVVAAFTFLSALLILTRPLEIFLPALLIVALLARGVALGQAREHALKLGLSLLLVYGCVAGYAKLNQSTNGYFGVSYVGDVNLFGVVMAFRMQGLPVSPALQPMQRQVSAYIAHGGWSPWNFARDDHYMGDNYAALGVFAKDIIRRYPLQYALRSALAMRQVALVKPGVDARGANTLAFTLARVIARGALLSYVALPLVALWLLWLLRKGWREPATFMAATLTLAVIASIAMIGAAGYDEFYRLRAPIDWAYLVAFMLVALDLLGRALQRLAGRERGA